MRSIAIMNQKGGVGKTTTAVNLAVALSRMNRRVCIIDLDPQAHASLHIGHASRDGEVSTYDLMIGNADVGKAVRKLTDRLSLIPSHIDLAAAEIELAGEVGREIILRDRLAELSQSAWDFVIIDCPPSLGVLTLNALAYTDEIFLPLQPHFLALHGLSKLLGTIDVVARRINERLRLTGVVLCMYDSGTRLAAEVSRDAASFFAQSRGTRTPWSDVRIFRSRIRRNIRLAEAPSFGQSIFEYAPHSNGALDYEMLASEVADDSAFQSDSDQVAAIPA
jgi:chromosome partitioning protein